MLTTRSERSVEGSRKETGKGLAEGSVVKITGDNTAAAESILERVFNCCTIKQLVLRAGKGSA